MGYSPKLIQNRLAVTYCTRYTVDTNMRYEMERERNYEVEARMGPPDNCTTHEAER